MASNYPEQSVSMTDTINKPPARIASIDILRALTMVLMIFVNDLWSLKDVPDWLGHVEHGVDGMGLSDVVFPAFLFIMGMSLPFAINNRVKKGDNSWQLLQHVMVRTLALLVMGVFLVNGESINGEVMGIRSWIWNPLCCMAFILIWNSYPATLNKGLVYGLKGLGVVALVALAILYRGGSAENPHYFSPQWWGILGLIGWSYLASSLIVVFAKNNFYWLLGGWLLFCILSIFSAADLMPSGGILSFVPNAIAGGTLSGFTMGGAVASFVFQYYRKRNEHRQMTLVFLSSVAVLVALSLIMRPYWGLSKLDATPAWLFLCSAITLFAFVLIYWIADVGGKANWFKLIKPAGTDTLLCYLIPYFIYAFFRLVEFRFPPEFLVGLVGLTKSFLLAMLCVLVTRGLNGLGIRLKL